MRVHIMADEKFIDTFIELSEEVNAPGGDIYCIRSGTPFNFVSSPLAKSMPLGTAELENLIDGLGETDEIYLHLMANDVANWLANRQPVKAKVIWIFWGAEFFNFTYDNTIAPYTQAYVEERKAHQQAQIKATKFSRFPILDQYRRYKHTKRLKHWAKQQFDAYQKALDRVDAIMHYNELDVDLVKSVFRYQGKFQYYYYAPAVNYAEVEAFIQNNKPPIATVDGAVNVWIANSASPTSNHKDAVMKIKGLQGIKTHLWLPANYGEPEYLDFLKQQVVPLMPGQITLITKYMSFGMFSASIAAMDASVLWHIRSQAFGNVQMLLYLGKKVFMHPESTLYKMLVADGYKIWSVDEINEDTIGSAVSAEDAAANKRKIAKEFSKEGSKKTIENAYLRSSWR